MVLRATRYLPYRVLADQIRHYAPARYLCGLTETSWSPDHNTVHDFISLMGEEGARFINEYAVEWAVEEKLADTKVLVADTTAQEATFPYPNEMGLMAAFLTALTAACKKGGAALKEFVSKAATKLASGSEKVRAYRLFAKTKTKAEKDRMTAELAALVEGVQKQLGKALLSAEAGKERLGKYARLATAKVEQLHETMKRLVPQIRYWLKTGFVATDKIISLHIPELYSIVSGKVGKAVEFGLTWGIRRLKGGYLLASVSADRRELVDAQFAVKAVEDHITLFGTAPDAYAYNRGGWSAANLASLKKLGVKHLGLAPEARRSGKSATA